jgi:hypothetical protein
LNIGYFGLEDYRDRRLDLSEADTSLTVPERHKSIADYGEVAPQKMKQLENMIDEVAGSNQWININAAAVREKVEQGWNIRSPEAGLMLLRAAEGGDADTVRAFIENGADANPKVDRNAWLWCQPSRRVQAGVRF